MISKRESSYNEVSIDDFLMQRLNESCVHALYDQTGIKNNSKWLIENSPRA